MTNVLVEGGAGLLGAFLDAGAVDEFHVFVAPKLVGGLDAPSPVCGVGIERMADALHWSSSQASDRVRMFTSTASAAEPLTTEPFLVGSMWSFWTAFAHGFDENELKRAQTRTISTKMRSKLTGFDHFEPRFSPRILHF